MPPCAIEYRFTVKTHVGYCHAVRRNDRWLLKSLSDTLNLNRGSYLRYAKYLQIAWQGIRRLLLLVFY